MRRSKAFGALVKAMTMLFFCAVSSGAWSAEYPKSATFEWNKEEIDSSGIAIAPQHNGDIAVKFLDKIEQIEATVPEKSGKSIIFSPKDMKFSRENLGITPLSGTNYVGSLQVETHEFSTEFVSGGVNTLTHLSNGYRVRWETDLRDCENPASTVLAVYDAENQIKGMILLMRRTLHFRYIGSPICHSEKFFGPTLNSGALYISDYSFFTGSIYEINSDILIFSLWARAAVLIDLDQIFSGRRFSSVFSQGDIDIYVFAPDQANDLVRGIPKIGDSVARDCRWNPLTLQECRLGITKVWQRLKQLAQHP